MRNSVLIVGAGPVGMLLAAQLAAYGVQARVVERRADFSGGSKALGINASSLKVLDSMGLAEAVIERGEKIRHIKAFWQSVPLLHIDCKRIRATRFTYSIALPQPETERVLAAHLQELGVAVERPVLLESIRHEADGVQVNLAHQDGSHEQARYEYVVGCDGSRSTVRAALGIGFQGRDYQSFMLLIDAAIDWEAKRPGEACYFVREEGFLIVIPLTGGLYRLVMSENDRDLAEMKAPRTLADYQRIVDCYVPQTLRLNELFWESQAPLYNRLAERFGVGRVLLAGDAAHLFSPIGGLGMNTGFQDATNLSWKLAGVLKGLFGEAILDSYRSERLEMARKLVAGTDDTTLMITGAGADHATRAQRWLPRMSNRPSLRHEWPLTFAGLGQRYDPAPQLGGSPTCHPLIGAHLPFAEARDARGARVTSYRLIRDGRPAFLALVGEDMSATVDDFAHRARASGFDTIAVSSRTAGSSRGAVMRRLIDPAQAYRRALQGQEGDVFLLRPDGYVADQGRLTQAEACVERASSLFSVCDPRWPEAGLSARGSGPAAPP